MAAQTLTLSSLGARRLSDENVFDRTLRGDPVAFSEVYRRYQKRIYGFCLARSLDPDTAADATQEVFMKLLRAEPGSIEYPRAWLFTVARNVVIDAARKRSRTPEDAGIEEESLAWDALKSADTADEVLTRSDARNVFLALRTLRPRYRTALIMREIHGQSAADMAEALETSPGAVDTLVSRARDAFGVAYASVSDLPSGCRSTIELVYRNLGTGIAPEERTKLDAHLSECERCRSEAKRAENPKHLSGLLPFLLPAKGMADGLLHRAAMAVRSFPDVVAQQGAAVAAQTHTWNLAAKIVAGLAAAAIVTAPIAARTALSSHPVARASVYAQAAMRQPGAVGGRLSMTTPSPGNGMTSWSNAGSLGGMSDSGVGTRGGGMTSSGGSGSGRPMKRPRTSSGTSGTRRGAGTRSGSGAGTGSNSGGSTSGTTSGSSGMGSGSGRSSGTSTGGSGSGWQMGSGAK